MIRIALALTLALAVSCAPLEKEPLRPVLPAEPIIWPPLPETPRIQFLYSFREPKDLGFRKPFLTRLWHMIAGEKIERMVRPYGISVDGPLIVVADPGLRSVHLFDTDAHRYERIVEAGDEVFTSPVGVAIGPDRIYVSDSYLGKVFVLDRRGRHVLTLDQLARPTGLAFDREGGRLYAADTLRNRIFVFDQQGRELFSFGTRGTGGGEFNFPTHLAFRNGTLYVNDEMNFRLQAFDGRGNPAFAFGSHGDGSGDFAQPKGVGADGEGHVYVVDAIFDRIQIFEPDGSYLLAFGRGEGSGPAEMWLPAGLAIDGNLIYVADSYNSRIQVFEFVGGE